MKKGIINETMQEKGRKYKLGVGYHGFFLI